MEMQRQSKAEKMILLMFMLLPTVLIPLNFDNDFWFLLNQGKYIVHNGFPTIEPFTIHPDLSFTIQQWLFDVLVYWLYTSFGKVGVMVLVFAAALVTLFLMYQLCMLLSEKKRYLSVLVTSVCYLLICIWFFVSRPQIMTYMLLLTQILCLEHYSRKRNWLFLLPLPIVSLLQINFHASMWWLLFAFMTPYLIETIRINKFSLNKEPLPKLGLYVVTGCMLGAGMVNPYGHRSILYIVGAFGNDTINASIQEMATPDIKTLTGLIYFTVLLVVVLCYVMNRKGKTKLRYTLLALGCVLLSLMSVKSIPYFLFGAVIPIAYQLKNIAHKLRFDLGKSKLQKYGLIAFLVLIFGYANYIAVHDYDVAKDYPPGKAAIEYLKDREKAEDVTMYTSFYDGGYAEYCGFQTYIDARAEVFLKSTNQKEDIFEEYMQLQLGSLHYKDFLEKYNFTHILVASTDTLEIFLSKDEGFSVYYEDADCKIYIPVISEGS